MSDFEKDIFSSLNKDIIDLRCANTQSILRGIVLSQSNELLLLYRIDDGYFHDGFTLLRKCDIKEYRIYDSDDYFIKRAQLRFHLFPQENMILPLSTIQNFLLLLKDKYPLVGVYKKKYKDNLIWIGKFICTTRKYALLKELDDEAQWVGTFRHNLDSIIRIEYGTRYFKRLWLMQQCEKKLHIS